MKKEVYSYNKSDLSRIPKRTQDSNKGTYGKVLVIAGDVGMSGAAYFSAKAAYKTGAGLVKIFTVTENREILQVMLPEAIVIVYDKEDIDIDILREEILWASVIVMGPGMGTAENTTTILNELFKSADCPVIIDADGLNVIAQNSLILKDHQANLIFTPHVVEMSRLINGDVDFISDNIIDEAQMYAHKNNLICVLKDSKTVVSDGSDKVYLNKSGNSSLATAGSGDVLTGVIAGLLAHGMDSLESSTLAVYMHGLAGEYASLELGEHSVMASDIISYISNVMKQNKI